MALLALVAASGWLALFRIYQVDECQNVFVAHLLSSGLGDEFATSITLYLAPLLALSGADLTSAQLFSHARLFALGLFWVNVVLLAKSLTTTLRSGAGLLAFLGAATLAPLWDYGFEVRHDNLLLTGLLLMALLLRSRQAGHFVLIGFAAITVALEFAAFKSFIYTVPLNLAVLTVLRPAKVKTVRSAAVTWAVSACASFAVIAAGYVAAGWWPLYVRDFLSISNVASAVERLTPWPALLRLVSEMPLIVALAVAGTVAVCRSAASKRRQVVSHPLFGPALLLAVATVAFLVNPKPFPYNLVNLAPFAFMVAFPYGETVIARLRPPIPVVIALVVLGHVVPFVRFTARHYSMDNGRQRVIMDVAEELTDPRSDFVYDGIGLVPTRRSVDRLWYLHSVNVGSFTTGDGPRVHQMLARRPAAVLIRSYRIDWLTPEDEMYRRAHYVPLADDIWILGAVLPPGGGGFRIIHPGRYQLFLADGDVPSLAQISPLGPEANVSIDGVPALGGAISLHTGPHVLQLRSNRRVGVAWLGPTLLRLPRLPAADHRQLFVNWY